MKQWYRTCLCACVNAPFVVNYRYITYDIHTVRNQATVPFCNISLRNKTKTTLSHDVINTKKWLRETKTILNGLWRTRLEIERIFCMVSLNWIALARLTATSRSTWFSAESVNISFMQRKAFTYDSPATFYQKSWKSPLFQNIHL